MGVEYTAQVGYGFLLEPIDKNEDVDDLMDAAYDDYEFAALSLERSGDLMSEDGVSIVAFVNDDSIVSFDEDSEYAGVVPLDMAPMLTNDMSKDLEQLKKFFHVVNEEPIPIATFTVG